MTVPTMIRVSPIRTVLRTDTPLPMAAPAPVTGRAVIFPYIVPPRRTVLFCPLPTSLCDWQGAVNPYCSSLVEESIGNVAEEVGLEGRQGHVPMDLQTVALEGAIGWVGVLKEHHLKLAGCERGQEGWRVGAGDRLAGLGGKGSRGRPHHTANTH